VEQVAALKKQAGGDLLLMCGPALLSTVSAERLVDKYILDVYPLALGHGVHLFGELSAPVPLSLLSSRPFPGGVDVQVYEPQYESKRPAAGAKLIGGQRPPRCASRAR
jgi:dihydrofolate reductase